MKLNRLVSLVVLCVFVVFPAEAAAQLVAACEGASCSACHIVDLGNNLIQWLIGIVTVLFAFMMAIAGFKLVTAGGNPSALQSAKDMFTNALIGFVIVLAAWLLVDTIVRSLVGNGGNITGWGFWADVQCWSQNTPTTVAGVVGIVREGATAADPIAGVLTPAVVGTLGNGMNEANTLAALGISGITYAPPGVACNASNFCISATDQCTDPTNSRCTGLNGVLPITAARARELQAAVGVPLVITGGTETGHTLKGACRHDNGCKLDFRTTPQLNTYIQNNFTNVGGSRWQDANGNVCLRHGASTNTDHWDCAFAN